MSIEERFNSALEDNFYSFLEENTNAKLAYLNNTISKGGDKLVELQALQRDIKFNEKHGENIPLELQGMVNGAANHLEHIINQAKIEILRTLQDLGTSKNPQERIIALRNGYNAEKLFDDTAPIVRAEIVNRNLDNEDVLMRFVNDESPDVKKEILKCKSEACLASLSNDSNDDIRNKAALLLDRLQAFNELHEDEQLLLVAECMDWNVHRDSLTEITLTGHTDRDYELEINIDLSDNHVCERYDIAEAIVEAAQNEYEYFDPDYEASLWSKDGHGVNGAPHYMEDLIDDMKSGETNIEKLANALHDAFYNNNYTKYISLTQLRPDDLKHFEGKEAEKNTIEKE